jgi:3-oxoacyl-[acyl-carrier protein] reductase
MTIEDHPGRPFAGRTVLVTGGSRGIGRATALALGARGATVAVQYVRREDAADATVAAITSAGGRAFALRADLEREDGPDALVAALRGRLERPELHGVVAAAGALVAGGIESVTAADLDSAFALNVRAPLFLVRAALPLLPRGARVVLVSAAMTRWANPGLLAQSAAKAAQHDLARNLAAALGPHGVGVVDVAPGATRTDLAAGLFDTPGAEAELAGATALGRAGEAADVAATIVALLAPEAHWITGQVIDASGGFRL